MYTKYVHVFNEKIKIIMYSFSFFFQNGRAESVKFTNHNNQVIFLTFKYKTDIVNE